jgi:hypothetical protein
MPEFRLGRGHQMSHRPGGSTHHAAAVTGKFPYHSVVAKGVKLIPILRWLALLGFCSWGAYMGLWSFQSASFSVPLEPPMKTIYETRALLALPIGVLMIAFGIFIFMSLRKR